MKFRPHLFLLALLAGLIALASGCKLPSKPKQFSNKIARGCKRLADAGKKFNKGIGNLAQSKPADVSETQSRLQRNEGGGRGASEGRGRPPSTGRLPRRSGFAGGLSRLPEKGTGASNT